MIRGTKRPVPEKKLSVNVGLHNRFDIEVRDAATGELRQRARAFNVICDTLWDRLLYQSTGTDPYWAIRRYSTHILFGSGSGTPAASDTALFTQIGYRSISEAVTHTDVLNGSAYVQTSVTLQAGDNVGDTLTEVGIGYDTTHCVTHAMLEDMNGNPISIEKTATDVITIYATIYFHWSAGGWSNGSIFIADNIGTNEGVSYQYKDNVIRAFAGRFLASASSDVSPVHWYSRVMGAIEAMDVGHNRDHSSGAWFTVNKAAKKVTSTRRYNVGVGNTSIRFINITLNTSASSYSTYLGQFCRMLSEGWYTPGAITGEAVGTGDGATTVFKTAFPVKTAGTVKVNGAAQSSGVTMRPGAINRQNAAYFLRPVAGKTSANTILYTLFPAGMSIFNSNSDGHTVLSVYTKTPAVVENPFYAEGITEFVIRANNHAGTITIEASDDLASWDAICTAQAFPESGSITISIPAALQNKRFFRLCTPTAPNSNYGALVRFVAGDGAEGNIIFSTPPAAGAVITCDYVPDCIAKDEDHVFDLTLEITFGEYQEV